MMNEIYLAKTENIKELQTVRLGGTSVKGCQVRIDTYLVKWLATTDGYDEPHHEITWVIDDRGNRWFRKVVFKSYLNPNPPRVGEFKKLF